VNTQDSQHVRVGVGVLVTRGDELLLLRRKNVHGDGTWSTPGGHMEFGESLEGCAIREVREETGLTISNVRLLDVTNDVFETEQRHYVTIWMTADSSHGDPFLAAPYESSKLGWFHRRSLPQPLFLPLRNLLDAGVLDEAESRTGHGIVLTSALDRLRQTKSLADRAIAQVSDDALRRPLEGDVNSIAVIIKHMAGNMRSRWTDFLTMDGEKPWRDRDAEFIDDFDSRKSIIHAWEDGWSCCFAAIESLTPDELLRTVRIRGERLTVIDAIHRQIEHYGYHVGQIMLIARIHVGPAQWKPLTIPLGESRDHNRTLGYDPEARP
jgi:ADP-ribose pyrophosphatase YjhB (NUDIX family)